MAIVKLLCARCGNGDPQIPGQLIEVPDDEAERMIADQQAEPAKGTPASKKKTK